MSDRAWETTADPEVVLVHVRARQTDRTARLVAAGFVRTVVHLLRTARSRNFLRKLEEFAAGTLSRDQLLRFQYEFGPPADAMRDEGRTGHVLWTCAVPRRSEPLNTGPTAFRLSNVCRGVALAAASEAAGPATGDTSPGSPWHVAFQTAWVAALARNADVARCAIPTPLRTVAFEPAWRTSTVVGVASQARATGDYSGTPILADALQDAGCCDEELLAHLRSGQGHHACCWGVRVVLDGAEVRPV